MNLWKSGLSILGGFFVAAVVLGGATVAASYLLLGGVGPGRDLTPAFLAVNAVNTVFSALIGGYVVATVVENRELLHAHVLGLFLAIVGVGALAFNGWEPSRGQPVWYALLRIAQAPLMRTLGGLRVLHRKRRPPKRYSKKAREADRAETEDDAEEA